MCRTSSGASKWGGLLNEWRMLDAATRTTRALKLVVLLDFFGVACLVPLLPSYFASVGCGNERLALISSAYNLSQLIGGVFLGWLSDGLVPRRTVLMISLLGSTIAYGMVGLSRSFYGLVLSRIVVGLVKQTMTISQAMVADLRVNRASRTQHVSHLQAAATLSFISGPALGGWLYSLSPVLPPLVASSSFAIASLICIFAVPQCNSKIEAECQAKRTALQEAFYRLRSWSKLQDYGLGLLRQGSGILPSPTNASRTPRTPRAWSPPLPLPPLAMRVLAVRVLSSFLVMALTPLHFVGFLESRYGLHKHHLGYLTSYRALLAFVAQTFIISYLVRRHTFSEEATARAAMIAIVAIKAFDVLVQNMAVYILVSTPVTVIAYSLLDSAMKGIYTDSVPSGHRGTALGSVGIFHSMLGIVAPLYGGMVFHRLDWIAPTVIFGHYLALLLVFFILLPPSQLRERHEFKKEYDFVDQPAEAAGEQSSDVPPLEVSEGKAPSRKKVD